MINWHATAFHMSYILPIVGSVYGNWEPLTTAIVFGVMMGIVTMGAYQKGKVKHDLRNR